MESRFCWTQCIGKPCLTQQSMIQLPRSCLDIHIITTLVWEKLLKSPLFENNLLFIAVQLLPSLGTDRFRLSVR